MFEVSSIENPSSTYTHYALTSQTGVTSYHVNAVPSSFSDYDWTSQTAIVGAVLPIELYMQAPQAAFTGDSIIAGHPTHYSFLETSATTNVTSTIEHQFGNITSYTYQNMGIGSQTTTSIAARFTSDVVNLKPRLVVVEGGVNDIAGGSLKTTFLNNWTTMLDAAQANSGISTVLVLKILPWTNGTTTQMQTRDDWNNSLATLAAGYSKAVVVDASSYVGQFRAGGDEGNLWNIQAAYNADGVHFNQAGHTQIAQALADALDSTAPTITSISSDVPNGTYGMGEVIDIDVTFSEPVTSIGDVTVTLETGVTDRTCTFTVSASTTATCNYVVQSGDSSADLSVSNISGTMKDAMENEMTSFGPATNLADNRDIVIDASGPTEESTPVVSTPSGGGRGSRSPGRGGDAPLIDEATRRVLSNQPDTVSPLYLHENEIPPAPAGAISPMRERLAARIEKRITQYPRLRTMLLKMLERLDRRLAARNGR